MCCLSLSRDSTCAVYRYSRDGRDSTCAVCRYSRDGRDSTCAVFTAAMAETAHVLSIVTAAMAETAHVLSLQPRFQGFCLNHKTTLMHIHPQRSNKIRIQSQFPSSVGAGFQYFIPTFQLK